MKPTANDLLRAAKIREKIEALESEFEKLMSGGSSKGSRAVPKAKKRAKRKLSKEARARISAAAKKRWKKAKTRGKKKLG